MHRFAAWALRARADRIAGPGRQRRGGSPGPARGQRGGGPRRALQLADAQLPMPAMVMPLGRVIAVVVGRRSRRATVARAAAAALQTATSRCTILRQRSTRGRQKCRQPSPDIGQAEVIGPIVALVPSIRLAAETAARPGFAGNLLGSSAGLRACRGPAPGRATGQAGRAGWHRLLLSGRACVVAGRSRERFAQRRECGVKDRRPSALRPRLP